MHERYEQLWRKVNAGRKPEGSDSPTCARSASMPPKWRSNTATMAYHFAGNTGLHHPHVIGRLLRDLNTAGIHQVMSDTAYENHGKFRLGLPADPRRRSDGTATIKVCSNGCARRHGAIRPSPECSCR